MKENTMENYAFEIHQRTFPSGTLITIDGLDYIKTCHNGFPVYVHLDTGMASGIKAILYRA